MLQDYSELNEMHRDVLLELGNIGTGSALTSLSRLTSHPIQMDLPSIRVTDVQHLPEIMDCGEKDCAGVVMAVHKDLDCLVTFLLSEDFTRLMAAELTGEEATDIRQMNAMQRSAVCEIGNIMCNSYLNALASMLEAELTVSVPELEVGSAAQVLGRFSGEFGSQESEVLFIQNTFHYLEQDFFSYILLHPNFESLRKILEKLG